MSGWREFLKQSLIALSAADFTLYPLSPPSFGWHELSVDLDDDTSVARTFRSIIEWEYGPAAFRRDAY